MANPRRWVRPMKNRSMTMFRCDSEFTGRFSFLLGLVRFWNGADRTPKCMQRWKQQFNQVEPASPDSSSLSSLLSRCSWDEWIDDKQHDFKCNTILYVLAYSRRDWIQDNACWRKCQKKKSLQRLCVEGVSALLSNVDELSYAAGVEGKVIWTLDSTENKFKSGFVDGKVESIYY